MNIKHIMALCLIFALVLPSAALAASNSNQQAKVSINVVNHGSKTVTVSYTLKGAKEVGHVWSFGDGFTCTCTHRTYTYKNHGKYNICITLKTTGGQTLKTCKTVTV